MAKTKKEAEKSVVKLKIVKANNLVEAKYKFDIWETRVFTKMLMKVKKDDVDFKDYRIYLHEVMVDFDLEKNKDVYKWLKRGARKLMTKIIKVVRKTDEGLKEFETPIAVGVETPLNVDESDGDMAFVDVSFHPKMKPFLLALKSEFTKYDVRNILKLPSSYSIRIYELLKQYEKIGSRKISLTELKEIIGVIEYREDNSGKRKMIDNYPLYGNFRQRVLLKAQKDLKKHTDICFTFEPQKRGRKVVEIVFNIMENDVNRDEEKSKDKNKVFNSTKKESNSGNKLYSEFEEVVVKDFGVTPNVFLKMLNTDNYTRENIEQAIAVTRRAKYNKVIKKEVAAFFVSALKEGYTDAKEEAKKREKEEAAKAKVIEKKKKELQEQLEKIEDAYLRVANKKIEELRTADPFIVTVALEAMKQQERFIPAIKKKEKELGRELEVEDCRQSSTLWHQLKESIMRTNIADFKDMVSEYQPKIEELKKQISALDKGI